MKLAFDKLETIKKIVTQQHKHLFHNTADLQHSLYEHLDYFENSESLKMSKAD